MSFEQAMQLADKVAEQHKAVAAEARARQAELEGQVAEGNKKVAEAILRAAKAEAEHDLPKAERLIEELRKSKDAERLQAALVELRDRHRDDLTARNREIAAVAFLRGDIAAAEQAINEILRLLPNDLDAINRLGHIHRLRGDLDDAIAAYQRVLDGANGDKEWEARAYCNLGIVYQTRGEPAKAEEHYRKALAIYEALGHNEGTAASYGNLGLVYFTRGEFAKAEEHHRKALAIHQTLGRKERMAIQYGNLGNVYGMRRDLAKAEEHYQKSLAINEALGCKEGVADLYANLGRLAKQRGNLKAAGECWAKSLDLYKQLGAKPRIEKIQGWIDGLPKE